MLSFSRLLFNSLVFNPFRRMPRNIEIKARVRDVGRLHEVAAELSQSKGELLEQEDTFFNCSQGRLKLRVIKVRFLLFLCSYFTSFALYRCSDMPFVDLFVIFYNFSFLYQWL